MAEFSRHQLRIAIVEDNDSIRELIELNLRRENYVVDAFFSAEQLEKAYSPGRFDLLLLDVMLPGKSGIQLAESLLQKEALLPILFISAVNQEQKITRAYELGAIDYIVKPFEIDHLLIKIRNLLHYFAPRQEERILPTIVGAAEINWDLLQVNRNGEIHVLTPKEAQTLSYFLNNADRVIPRTELMEKIWGQEHEVSSRNIDNYMVRFRRMFEENPAEPRIFITYPKKGYACKWRRA